MNRARGGSVIRRSKGTEQCDYVVTRVRIYHFLRAASVKAIVGAVNVWLQSRSLPVRGRVGLEVHRWRVAIVGALLALRAKS